MADDIDVEEAAVRLDGGALLLDVREQDEWNFGHAAQAVHIPMSIIAGNHESLPKDREIVVACKVGGRSAQVAAFLEQQGYNAVNLDGGMLAWQASERPLVNAEGNNGVVI